MQEITLKSGQKHNAELAVHTEFLPVSFFKPSRPKVSHDESESLYRFEMRGLLKRFCYKSGHIKLISIHLSLVLT